MLYFLASTKGKTKLIFCDKTGIISLIWKTLNYKRDEAVDEASLRKGLIEFLKRTSLRKRRQEQKNSTSLKEKCINL